MVRAQHDLAVQTWFSGLRRSQSSTRANTPIVSVQRDVVKFCPIVEWSNKDVHYYLKDHNLPYHPLWEQGYVSVGDTHSTRPLELGMTEEETRFNGLGRECGLHVAGDGI
jgi:phosphoadenosine phosphosulfate reductase